MRKKYHAKRAAGGGSGAIFLSGGGLGGPRVVGADAPEVAFEVAAGEGAAAVVHVADVEDHLGTGGFGGGVDGVGVVDDEVDALGFAEADLVGLDHELAGLAAIVDGAEHDHAVAEGELGVHDCGVVGAEVDGLLLKPKARMSQSMAASALR